MCRYFDKVTGGFNLKVCWKCRSIHPGILEVQKHTSGYITSGEAIHLTIVCTAFSHYFVMFQFVVCIKPSPEHCSASDMFRFLQTV